MNRPGRVGPGYLWLLLGGRLVSVLGTDPTHVEGSLLEGVRLCLRPWNVLLGWGALGAFSGQKLKSFTHGNFLMFHDVQVHIFHTLP